MVWIYRWDTWLSQAPVLPGVWLLRDGGYLVRSRTRDPRTGKRREVKLRLGDHLSPEEAHEELLARVQEISSGRRPATSGTGPRFADFAYLLLAKKTSTDEITSPKVCEKWSYVITNHLVPRWGNCFVDRISYEDMDEWRTEAAHLVKEGRIKPSSFNTVFSVFRVIVTAFYRDRRLANNPSALIKPLPLKLYRTYTAEEPNSLTAEELHRFVCALAKLFPQHLAMAQLGFATGLRPSSLRPLRRCGTTPDVIWETGAMLIRRSVTSGEVVDATKTGVDYTIWLPLDILDLLRWHVATQLPSAAMRQSDLLFPSVTGGFRAPSVLEKPFAQVASHIGLRKRITARAMRRTWNALGRASGVPSIVTRSVCGHATEKMQGHYSTVRPEEQRQAILSVLEIAGLRGSSAAHLRSGG